MELRVGPYNIEKKVRRRGLVKWERLFLVVGIIALAIYCGMYVYSNLYQACADYSFEQYLKNKPVSIQGFVAYLIHRPVSKKLAEHDRAETKSGEGSLYTGESPTNTEDWSATRLRAYEESLAATPGAAIARLEIPAIDLSVIMMKGTDKWTLNRAVGHIEGTALPGERGNLGIAGHRDGFFRGLKDISKDDDITLTTVAGKFHYRVKEIEIVKPTDTRVLLPTPRPTLTLVTCYPFYFVGDAPKRFIVKAESTDN